MADYQDIRGLRVKYLSADPANSVVGEVWYNSTTGTLKSMLPSASWASGGALATAREGIAGFGIQTAAIAAGGESPVGGLLDSTEQYNGSTWTAGGALHGAEDQITGTGLSTAALAFGGNPAIAITQGYDGTAWSTRPALGTGRGYMMGCGIGTSALGIGGQAPPSGTTATEEFTGETTAGNYKTITTS